MPLLEITIPLYKHIKTGKGDSEKIRRLVVVKL